MKFITCQLKSNHKPRVPENLNIHFSWNVNYFSQVKPRLLAHRIVRFTVPYFWTVKVNHHFTPFLSLQYAHNLATVPAKTYSERYILISNSYSNQKLGNNEIKPVNTLSISKIKCAENKTL
jgi:hypothetical protein